MFRNMFRKMKLMVIRIAAIVAVTVMYAEQKATKGKLELPLKWLLHYLEGSGEPLEVPQSVLEEDIMVFYRAIDEQKRKGNFFFISSSRPL